MSKKEETVSLYYDGSCTLCAGIVKKLGSSSESEKIEAVDVTSGRFPNGVNRDAALNDVHVVDASGNVCGGVDAILHILNQYPRWRLLAKIGAAPIVKQLLALGTASLQQIVTGSSGISVGSHRTENENGYATKGTNLRDRCRERGGGAGCG